MSQIVDDLTAEVAKVKDVNVKAVALLSDLVTKLNDAKTDPVAIEALIADLDTSTKALADEAAKDTSPAPVVDPVPAPVDNPVA